MCHITFIVVLIQLLSVDMIYLQMYVTGFTLSPLIAFLITPTPQKVIFSSLNIIYIMHSHTFTIILIW